MIGRERIEAANRLYSEAHRRAFGARAEELAEHGCDVEAVIGRLQALRVAAPSWALGTGARGSAASRSRGSLGPPRRIDASHNLKDPLDDLLQSTEAIQIAFAQALLLDRAALAAAQDANDPTLAAEIINDAFRIDARPLVREARRRSGGALSLVAAYRDSEYRTRCAAVRGSSIATGL